MTVAAMQICADQGPDKCEPHSMCVHCLESALFRRNHDTESDQNRDRANKGDRVSDSDGDTGVADSVQYEQRGVPLTEGGLRYTIHPVTGQLLTTEVLSPSRDLGAAPHKPHRDDKTIIKVRLQIELTTAIT